MADESFVRLTRGNATSSEIAAITALLFALNNSPEEESASQPSQRERNEQSWHRRRALNLAPRAGADSWRRSTWN